MANERQQSVVRILGTLQRTAEILNELHGEYAMQSDSREALSNVHSAINALFDTVYSTPLEPMPPVREPDQTTAFKLLEEVHRLGVGGGIPADLHRRIDNEIDDIPF
jgi:hypothetical protein